MQILGWQARTAKFRQHWSKWQALTKCSLNFLAPTSMDAAPCTLDPLSQTQTRMSVDIELEPQTLYARLFVQSLKLARAQANKRFQERISRLASYLENQAV
jgi:hypothetical protein